MLKNTMSNKISYGMNKKPTLLFLIVCMVFISILGIFAIGIAGHGEHSICPVSVFSGGECSDTFTMAMHHISGIKALAEGVLTPEVSVLIVLLILVTGIVSWFIKPADFIDNLVANFRYIYIRHTAHPIFTRILKWITLHNKLDTYSYFRARGNFIS